MATGTHTEVKRLTPVLIVETIEPCLAFWEKVGFTKTMGVVDQGRLGFAILSRDGVEVMLQARYNLAHDLPGANAGPAIIYLDVVGLDAIASALGGEPLVHPRRLASYGADEIWVRDPSGNVVGFAERA